MGMFNIAHAAIRVPTSLVPCGTSATGNVQCTPCHLWLLADNIINFILWLSLPILVIALLYGGIIWLISVGNPAQIERGKAIIWNALVGILIAFLAWLIVDSLIKTLASGRPVAAWNNAPTCEQAIVAPPAPPPQPPTGLSCNSQNQCVQGGGGKTCALNSDCVALLCSASTVSPLVDAVVSCVKSQAISNGLAVTSPTANQLNGGSHTCNLPTNISCHYGGTKCNGVGNAVDFSLSSARTPANWEKLRQLTIQCGASGGTFCESGSIRPTAGCIATGIDHVHANASSACGCQ